MPIKKGGFAQWPAAVPLRISSCFSSPRSGQGAYKYSSWHATPASLHPPALGRRALDVRAHFVQLSVPGWRTRQACQLLTSIHGKPGWAAAAAAAVAATASDRPRRAQQGPGHAGACHPGHCTGVPIAGMLPGYCLLLSCCSLFFDTCFFR